MRKKRKRKLQLIYHEHACSSTSSKIVKTNIYVTHGASPCPKLINGLASNRHDSWIRV